ncbi:MAG: methyl-accepting chemotaxis protein [Aeromonadaceae bacterium]
MNLNIRKKLLLALTILLLITAGLQQLYTRHTLLAAANKEVTRFESSVAEVQINGLKNWLDTSATIVSSTKIGFITTAEEEFAKSNNAKNALLQAAHSGKFDMIYIGTNKGEMIVSNDWEAPAGYDPRQRPWYQGAIAANRMIITAPYTDASTGELIISMAEPFKLENVEGVIAGDISLQSLIQNVNSIAQEGVYGLLTDGDGNLIAHKNPAMTLKPASQLAPELTKDKIRDLANSGKPHTMLIDGRNSIVYFTPIPGYEWYFGLIYDEETALATNSRLLQQSLLATVLQLLIVAGGAAYIITLSLKPLNAMGDAVAELAQGNGDLTRRITIHRNDEVGAVARQINLFIDMLQGMMSALAASARELDGQAKQSHTMASHNDESLARQQSEISQIATAVHEMSATATEVASNAEQTAAAAHASAASCDHGKQVIINSQRSITNLAGQVEQASNIIQELEKNAQEINTILSTIQGIAEQTNLLALNAAIEAARAGEQGRGFAVVADEVRVLSKRTHSSTVEIRAMIETLQRNTQQAVQTMHQSQQLAQNSVADAGNATLALEQITHSISEISDMATQISSAAEEQRAVTDEVGRNIQATKDVSDELSLAANSANRLATQLKEIALRINEQVNNFHV